MAEPDDNLPNGISERIRGQASRNCWSAQLHNAWWRAAMTLWIIGIGLRWSDLVFGEGASSLVKTSGQALMATSIVLLAVYYFFVWRRAVRLEIHRLMVAEGFRPLVCGRCNYNLRALTGETCPECGCRIA